MSDVCKVFLDTNILVYALDIRDPVRQQRAAGILREVQTAYSGVLSTQVLQECYVVATTKLGMEPLTVKALLGKLHVLEIVLVDVPLIETAIDCSVLSRIAFWDALIVAAAAKAGCAEIWTEDLNAGQVIHGVRVRNPFT